MSVDNIHDSMPQTEQMPVPQNMFVDSMVDFESNVDLGDGVRMMPVSSREEVCRAGEAIAEIEGPITVAFSEVLAEVQANWQEAQTIPVVLRGLIEKSQTRQRSYDKISVLIAEREIAIAEYERSIVEVDEAIARTKQTIAHNSAEASEQQRAASYLMSDHENPLSPHYERWQDEQPPEAADEFYQNQAQTHQAALEARGTRSDRLLQASMHNSNARTLHEENERLSDNVNDYLIQKGVLKEKINVKKLEIIGLIGERSPHEEELLRLDDLMRHEQAKLDSIKARLDVDIVWHTTEKLIPEELDQAEVPEPVIETPSAEAVNPFEVVDGFDENQFVNDDEGRIVVPKTMARRGFGGFIRSRRKRGV